MAQGIPTSDNNLSSKNKIEITYRIAVVQNESALLRTAYNNIFPNFHNISKKIALNTFGVKENYEFMSFTSANIDSLFLETGNDYIGQFDALIIATNSTNDSDILSRLNNNKNHIENFLSKNRGLAIFSQKKLSKKTSGIVDFLPIELSYQLVERKDTKDSSKGVIACVKNNDVLMQGLTEKTINDRSEINPFKPHKYRSILNISNEGFYEKILYDKENSVDKDSTILARCKNKNIVITSMALDQTEQNELLANIFKYIIKGVPTIGFVGVDENRNNLSNINFNNLYYITRLAKYPSHDYKSFSDIDDEEVFSIYIISPSIPTSEVNSFWEKIKNIKISGVRKNIKVYQIEGNAVNEKIVREFSNFSAVDLIIEKTLLWISSSFDNPKKKEDLDENANYFGNSFWISYDSLLLFFDALKTEKFDFGNIHSSFVQPILNKIEKSHFRIENEPFPGSYDGVYNCTCAMFEIFNLLDALKTKNSSAEVINTNSALNPELTYKYIIENFESVSNDDKLYALFALNHYYKEKEIIFSKESDEIKTFKKNVEDQYSKLLLNFESSDKNSIYENYTEIDLCRQIKLITIILENNDNEVVKSEFLLSLLGGHLMRLRSLQINGRWGSISKTAIIIKMLIKSLGWNTQITYENVTDTNNQIITDGINYLISAYSETQEGLGNWHDDLLASINSTHALLLYDLSNSYTIKDFKDSIARDLLTIQALDSTTNNINALTTLRNNNNLLNSELKDRTNQKSDLAIEFLAFKKEAEKANSDNADELKKLQTKYELRLTIAITLGLGCLFLFLFEKYALLSDLGTIIKAVLGFVLSGFLTWLVKETVDLNSKRKK